MRLLIDENVPASVVDFLRERPHEIILVREALAAGTPDPVVLALADQEHATIVTVDKDFRALLPRRPPNNHLRYRRAGRISFLCGYARALSRIEYAAAIIEAEHAFLQTQTDRRLIVEIHRESIVIDR